MVEGRNLSLALRGLSLGLALQALPLAVCPSLSEFLLSQACPSQVPFSAFLLFYFSVLLFHVSSLEKIVSVSLIFLSHFHEVLSAWIVYLI